MNDLPRQKLREIVANCYTIANQRGHNPLTDAEICKEMLLTLCTPGNTGAIDALVAAVREGIPTDIEHYPQNKSIEGYLHVLSERLVSSDSMPKNIANWVVESWAEALDRHVMLPAPPPFFSTSRAEVFIHSQDDSSFEWQLWGETPWMVELPPNHDIGIRPRRMNYSDFKLWVNSLEMPERVRYLDLSNMSLEDPSLEHLRIFKELETLDLSRTDISGEGLAYLENLPIARIKLCDCKMLSDKGISQIAKLKDLRDLNLERCTAITAQGLQALKHLPRLNTLNLKGCTALQEDAFEVLAALLHLKSLDLSETHFTGMGFLHFRTGYKLKILKLQNCAHLNDEGVAHLLRLNSLEGLHLGNTAISDQALNYITWLPRLRQLDLGECIRMTGQGLQNLCRLSQLSKLSLKRCTALQENAFATLAQLPQLNHLDLSYTSITAAGLQRLSQLVHLQTLSLKGCTKLQEDGLKALAAFSQLQHLDLSEMSITGDFLKTLQSLTRLQTLYLMNCQGLKEDALETLAKFPQLINLNLSGTLVTGIGFQHFQNDHPLQRLALDKCNNLTDHNLEYLEKLFALNSLSLEGTAITDQALDYLIKLPRLRWLYLMGCNRVSMAKIRAMRSRISVFTDERGLQSRIILGESDDI